MVSVFNVYFWILYKKNPIVIICTCICFLYSVSVIYVGGVVLVSCCFNYCDSVHKT